ncbi:MAG: L-lysine 6-transaminase [Acidobacteriota bacterium]
MKQALQWVSVAPKDVHTTLKKHMLIDGFEMVVDLEKSSGTRIYDSRTGNILLDFFTFFATSPIGLNHPRMLTPEAKERLLRAAVNKPSNSDVYTIEMAEFVKTFSSMAMPDYLPHLFLIEGGALGVENALKASFDWKIRKNFKKGYREEKGTQVIHFQQAFHGRTGYTLSLTNTADPRKTMYFPKFNWPRIVNPKIRFPLEGQNLEDVIALERSAVEQIKTAFYNNKDDIAAIIIEPIQGEGGDNHFRPEFLQELRRLADENDAMLIFDEVQAGLGLTGKWWATNHFSVKPDFICFGKKVQVCGMMCGKRIEEVEDNVFKIPSRLNSTWGGNLTDMVRSTMYLKIIAEEGMIDNAAKMGEYMRGEILKLQREFPEFVSNARGRGLMCAFDCPTAADRDELRKICYANNLIILGCGHSSIRFRPALNISQPEIDEGMSILRKSIRGKLSKR